MLKVSLVGKNVLGH